MVVSFALWTAMAGLYESHNKAENFGIAQIVFIWIFGIFYSIGFSGLLVAYTLEVLPFHLRAKGIMIMNITVQAILAISAQTNPVAIENLPHAWNFWLFYTVSPTIPLLECFEICSNTISSFGTASRLSGSTSCSPKPRAPPSKRSPRFSTVMRLWLTSAWNRLR